MSDTDLNERAGLAERWAARNPALLERAVHSLDAGLLILDATQPGCPIAFANEAFERMTGYSCAEAVGQRCPMLQGPDTDPAAIAELDAALREARAARVTVLNYRKDGTPFWNEVSVSPLRGDDGTLLQHIAFHQDVSAREVALQGLREAELRYRGLVENLVGVVPYVAENDGTAAISYIAPQIERLLGYPHRDWLGPRTVWYRALHPDDRERVLAVQRRRFDDGEALDLEYRLIAADGQVHWVSDRDTATASADGAVQRREGMLVDITAIKEAESALARGDERNRSVVESLEEGVLVIGAGGRPVASNPSARRILGADPMEGGFDFRGVDVWLEDGTRVDRANSLGHRAVVDGEPVRDVVMRFVRPDGEERWASLNYQPLVVPGEPHHSELVVSFRDITEQRRVTDALRQSEERLRSVIAGAPVHMWAIDTDGYYTLLEGRGLQDLGLTAGELVGQSLFEVFKDAPQACDANRQALEGKQFSRQTELRGLTFESHFSPLRDDDGEVIGALGVAIDITERKRAEERLSHLALHDTLTGLPNRTLFLDRLEHALVRGRREKSHLCVLFIDLDRFKRINDSLGHQSGDQILLETADRIAHALRADDSVSRLGGDEFTVLCEGIRDEDEALAVADKVAEELGQLYDVDDAELYVTASIGVALSDSDSTPEQLLRDADAAMYRAKSRGRDRVELFDEVSRSHTVNRLELEHALHGAVERGEFCLHYQPKVSLATGRVIGFEALLRWQHPERGLLAPDDFISIAEDSGLIVPIGRWVIEEAARQGAAWGAGRDSEPVICVNLSARQFAQPDLVQVVAAAVDSSGISPGAFCLEITESVVMEQTHATIATLGELKKLGLPLAIDDFGTGYSSLGYLQRFRLDYLKIDRSFVEGLGHDREQTAIVDAIVKMAQALGLRVIAEGVETEAQVETLRALGCDMVQGFLFARPQPPEEAATHLDETVYASAAP